MITQIKVSNFKSLKHLDYSCANLNLLTGMNGSGKSSFIQLLLLLRSISPQMTKPSFEFELNPKLLNAKKYSDIQYCYSEADTEFEVSYVVRPFPSTRFVLRKSSLPDDQGGYFEHSVHRLVRRTREPDEIQITSPKFYEENRRTEDWQRVVSEYLRLPMTQERKTFVQGVIERFLVQGTQFSQSELEPVIQSMRDAVSNASDEDIAVVQDRQEIAVFRRKLRMVFSRVQRGLAISFAQLDEIATQLFEEAFRKICFVSAFRDQPKEIHNGGNYKRGRSLRSRDKTASRDFDGENIAEYLAKYGKNTKIYQNQDNPMVFPGFGDWRPAKRNSEGRIIGLDHVHSGPFTTLNDQVRAWLNVISPGANITCGTFEVGDDERVKMAVDFGDGTCGEHAFKPQAVGFGISYILPVLVALLTAEPDDIVIIENPEAHLHPKGQAKMGELIARAAAYGVQVFVETHSDHVINGVRVATKNGILQPNDINIAFFTRGMHEEVGVAGKPSKEVYSTVSNIKVDKNGSLSEYPADFMDEWNNQLMELLK